MIITHSSLILSPSPELDLNVPVIAWDNLVRFGAVTADSEDSLHPASNLSRDATTYRWQSLSTATQYVTVDTSPDDPVDCFAIVRHNLGSAQIKVSGEAYIDGSWVEVFPEQFLGDDSPALWRFTTIPSAELFRLKLQPTAAIAPTIAGWYVGKLLYLQRRIYVGHTPLPYGREVDFTNGLAENGDFQGRIELRKRLTTSVSLQNITSAWYRSNLDMFVALGRKKPFFFAWRPYTYPKEVGYAWLTNDPRPTNQRANGMMQIAFQMGGLVL